MKDKKEERDNELGISPLTYGLGVAGKYSLMLITAFTTVLSTVGLTLFKPNHGGWRDRDKLVNVIDTPKRWLEGALAWAKKALGENKNIEEAKNAVVKNEKGAGAIIAASLGLAVVMAHILQAPAFFRGRKKAKEAAAKYDALVDQNTAMAEKLAQYGETVPEATEAETKPGFVASVPAPAASHAEAAEQRKDIPPVMGM